MFDAEIRRHWDTTYHYYYFRYTKITNESSLHISTLKSEEFRPWQPRQNGVRVNISVTKPRLTVVCVDTKVYSGEQLKCTFYKNQPKDMVSFKGNNNILAGSINMALGMQESHLQADWGSMQRWSSPPKSIPGKKWNTNMGKVTIWIFQISDLGSCLIWI